MEKGPHQTAAPLGLDRRGRTGGAIPVGPHHWGWTRGAIPVGLNIGARLERLDRRVTLERPHRRLPTEEATPVGHTVGAGPEGLDRRITPERPYWRSHSGRSSPEGPYQRITPEGPHCSSLRARVRSLSVNKGAQHLAAGAHTPTLAVMSCVRTCDGSCTCVSSPLSFSPGVMG